MFVIEVTFRKGNKQGIRGMSLVASGEEEGRV